MPKTTIHRDPYIDKITYIKIPTEMGSINSNRYEDSLLSTKNGLLDTVFKWVCASPTTCTINKETKMCQLITNIIEDSSEMETYLTPQKIQAKSKDNRQVHTENRFKSKQSKANLTWIFKSKQAKEN